MCSHFLTQNSVKQALFCLVLGKLQFTHRFKQKWCVIATNYTYVGLPFSLQCFYKQKDFRKEITTRKAGKERRERENPLRNLYRSRVPWKDRACLLNFDFTFQAINIKQQSSIFKGPGFAFRQLSYFLFLN